MKIKLELFALAIGILGTGMFLVITTRWGIVPLEFREYFRGGNFGAQLLGLCIVIGFAGVLFMFSNLIFGYRDFWWQRCISSMIFLFLTVSLASLI